MTQASSTVRAVARVGTAAPEPDAPAVLIRRTRPGLLGSFSLGRVLIVEFMALLLVAAFAGPLWTAAATGLAGALVAVLALGRGQHRWWTERWLLGRRLRARRSTRPARTPDPRLRALRGLAPDLQVADVTGGDGAPVGIGTDGAGWYAVAAVNAAAGLRGDLVTELPLARLARLISESGQPGAVIQVVVHSTPSPAAALDAQQWCAASYQELIGRYGPMPASQAAWISVRLDARALARASLGGPDQSGQAAAVVAGLIRRVSRALSRAGVATTVLDADGLLDALLLSCDLTPNPDPDQPAAGREEHAVWHSAGYAQTCLWIERWPDPAGAGPVLRTLANAPGAAFTSVSLVLEPRDDGTALHGLLRVAGPAEQLAGCVRTVTELAGQGGTRLLRLDREQAPAVYASAPTGGGAR